MNEGPRILIVRMGAFGDVLHTLPVAASLKRTIPGARVSWLVEEKWQGLLAGNPDVDDVLALDRRSGYSVTEVRQRLRMGGFDIAIDVQGLLKSALAVRESRAKRRIGFSFAHLREKLAGLFYTDRVRPTGTHVVEKNLSLADYAGARERILEFPVPLGAPEGSLPTTPYVLACPTAGWPGKQWPLNYYRQLGELLQDKAGHVLVLNVSRPMAKTEGVWQHVSGMTGLIHATRNAAAVVGLDSGPMHLAAALQKPGIALFGPTDPTRNGPFGGSLRVLRDPSAVTTYKRLDEIQASMRALTPSVVFEQLVQCLNIDSRNPTLTR